MTKAPFISPEDILESLADGVFTVDSSWRITSFNRGAEKITGISRQQAVGKPCCEVFHANICSDNCPLKRAMTSGTSTLASRAFITNAHGRRVPVHVSAAVLRNSNDHMLGGVETFQDLRLLGEGIWSMDQAIQACEVQTIIAALRRNNNNRAAAARDLGIHKSTFFRKIKHLGIDLPEADGRFRSGHHGKRFSG